MGCFFPPLRGCFSLCCLCCSLLQLWFFLHWICLAFLLWLLVVYFLTRSNLRFPSRRGLPLGTSQAAFGLCFLGFQWPAFAGVLSVLPPFLSSALFASGLLFVFCSPRGFLSFPWCTISFGVLFCFGFMLFLHLWLAWFRSSFAGGWFYFFRRSFRLLRLFCFFSASLGFFLFSFLDPPLGFCSLLSCSA